VADNSTDLLIDMYNKGNNKITELRNPGDVLAGMLSLISLFYVRSCTS